MMKKPINNEAKGKHTRLSYTFLTLGHYQNGYV
jgi:hypothetical protein